jgi:hypothetical protein
MDAGSITIDGFRIGTISVTLSDETPFVPDIQGYTPLGRAEEGLGGSGGGQGHPPGQSHHSLGGRHGGGHPHEVGGHPHGDGSAYGYGGDVGNKNPQTYSPGSGRPFTQGSADTDAAIKRAAKEAGVDVNTMRGIASIESGMNPSSNANRSTQYKGLYQIGHDEWRRFGHGGNIYSAEDNAAATGRMFSENKRQFRSRFGRDPSDSELYLMHQQGLGFYTNNAMTNISGNPYPGMRGPQTHESFEAGWGRGLARRKSGFEKSHPAAKQADAIKVPDDI